jgi:hypothetical protein
MDLVHGSMVNRGKGVSPDLIRVVGRGSGGCCGTHVACDGGAAAPGGAGGGACRSPPDLERPATVWDAAEPYS